MYKCCDFILNELSAILLNEKVIQEMSGILRYVSLGFLGLY